jgi:hypothetical protein
LPQICNQEVTHIVGTTDAQAIDKIKKLAEMKDAGIITEEEFSSLKSRLLTQI